MMGHELDPVTQCGHTWLDTNLIRSHKVVTPIRPHISGHEPNSPAYGRIWPHMAAYDHTWPHIWPHMAALGHIWPHMAAHGRTWPHMAAYARIWPQKWPHMTAYGRIWPNMVAYGAPLGTSGSLWLPVWGPLQTCGTAFAARQFVGFQRSGKSERIAAEGRQFPAVAFL